MPLEDPALLKSIVSVSQLAEFSNVRDSQKCRAGLYPLCVGLKGRKQYLHYRPQTAGMHLLVLVESAVKISFGGAELWERHADQGPVVAQVVVSSSP